MKERVVLCVRKRVPARGRAPRSLLPPGCFELPKSLGPADETSVIRRGSVGNENAGYSARTNRIVLEVSR